MKTPHEYVLQMSFSLYKRESYIHYFHINISFTSTFLKEPINECSTFKDG